MKSRTIAGVVAAAFVAGPSAGAAERGTTWLTPIGGVVGPFSATVQPRGFFYSQPIVYKGAAQLRQPFVDGSGVNALTVPAGEPLFQVEAASSVFWCTARSFRQVDVADALGLGLRNSILGQLAGKSPIPRQLSSQCFRDKDGDMAFDEVGGGVAHLSTVTALVGAVNDVIPLPVPLRYERADPAKAFAPVTLGLGILPIVDRKGRNSYLVSLCYADLRPSLKAECFEQQQYSIGPDGGLPASIEVLGGKIVITALAAADNTATTVTYSVERPFSVPLSASIYLRGQGPSGFRKVVILVPGA